MADAKDASLAASDEAVPSGLAAHVDKVPASHRPRKTSIDDDGVRPEAGVAAEPRVQLPDVLVRRNGDFPRCKK